MRFCQMCWNICEKLQICLAANFLGDAHKSQKLRREAYSPPSVYSALKPIKINTFLHHHLCWKHHRLCKKTCSCLICRWESKIGHSQDFSPESQDEESQHFLFNMYEARLYKHTMTSCTVKSCGTCVTCKTWWMLDKTWMDDDLTLCLCFLM